MSKTKHILRRVSRRLPLSLEINRSVVYKADFIYFARGLLLEQTPYKDIVRLRRFLLPFFGYLGFAHVTYSPRVSLLGIGETDDIVGSPDEVGDQIVAWIERENFISWLTSPYTPSSFLPSHRSKEPFDPEDLYELGRMNTFLVFDLLAAAWLARETGFARTCLQVCDDHLVRHAAVRRPDDPFPRELQAFHAALDQGLPELDAHLRRVCHDNAVALGFKPAPLDPPPPK